MSAGASLLALVLMMSVAGPAAGVAVADSTPPSVVGISFSPATVRVSGLDTADVTVRVRLTDDTGVVPFNLIDQPSTPLVVLWPTSGSAPKRAQSLDLTSGTPKDGIWSGVVHVPSTYDGVWQVAYVEARDEAGNVLQVDPRMLGIAPALTVVGVHRPRVSMGFSPDPVLGYGPSVITVKGRAIYADTGRPISGLPLQVANNLVDGGGCDVGSQVVTNSLGYYSISLPYDRATFYLSVYRAGTLAICRWQSPRVKFLVAAAAARKHIRLGHSVEIRGNVAPATGGRMGPVYLQRLVSGRWRTVNQGTLRSSGRYSVIATPPTIGNHRYRVYKPGSKDGHSLGAASRTVIVGVR